MSGESSPLESEIHELTDQFRSAVELEWLRDLVTSQGVSPDDLLYVGKIDGDEVGDTEHDYGCFVEIKSVPGLVICYCATRSDSPRQIRSWVEKLECSSNLLDDYPAAEVGQKMARGEIPSRWLPQ